MYLLFRAPEDRGDRDSAVSTPSRTPQGSVVVDDEPDVLRSISRVLDRHGYRTHRAATGEDGVRQWKVHRPDVTLCDLRLPGINGMAVLERLKARHAIVIVAEARAARSGRTSVPPLGLAGLFAHAGERERVLEWLEKAYEEHDPNLPYIGVIPLFDIVRDDPRFQDLLRRMNLPQ